MAAVLIEALEECGEGAVTRDERGIDCFDRLHHLERLAGDTFAGSCGCEDKALEIGIIALAGEPIAEIELRQTGADGGKCGHEKHVTFCRCGGLRKHALQRFGQVAEIKVIDDVQIVLVLAVLQRYRDSRKR